MIATSWLRPTLPIAAIFACRMLGLFMLIPIFSVYGQQLSGSTPVLIGVALGAYGFSQGIMQMPFGILSDYFGRKPLLFIGLLLFAIGSIIGIYATTIYGMILARTIQGFGAIGSVLIALLADVVDDNHRPKSMAIIGMSIGLSFALAMILSPYIAHQYGLSGIFKLTVLLIIIAFGLLIRFVPKPQQTKPLPFNRHLFTQCLITPKLLNCHIGIFGQHLILTSSFFAIPLILKSANIPLHNFYLSLMLIAFILMLPLIHWAERHKARQKLFIISIIGLGFSQLFLTLIPHHYLSLWSTLIVYFLAFNILEALFPSMIASAAHANLKGTATGIYSSSQFLGIFSGGVISGILYKHFGTSGIFGFNTLLVLTYIGWQKMMIKKTS